MGPELDRRNFLKTAGVSAASTLAVGSNILQTGGGMAEAAEVPATYMSKPLIPIDLTKSPREQVLPEQVLPLHNRWHPDIPSVVTVKPGVCFASSVTIGRGDKSKTMTVPTTFAMLSSLRSTI